MKKGRSRNFFKYFIGGALLSWLILTCGVVAKGQINRLFSGRHLLLVIGIYLLTGLICGSCFATFLVLRKK